jgi:VWFA-related protein
MRLSRASLTVFALSLAAAAGSPQEARKPPVYSTDVSLVLLPVFVAGADGHALRGLQPEDFDVQADGKPVQVVSFRYVDTTAADDQDEIREAPSARRRFLLLFDKSFTDPSGLNRAQRAALNFVRRGMARSDLASVATVDVQRGLKVVANFTEDRALLAHAVETLGVPSLARISDPLGLAADMAVTDVALQGRGSDTLSSDATVNQALQVLVRQMRAADDNAYRAQVATLAASFQDLGRALRTVAGRKQVLYFSAGFDSRVLIGESGRDQREATQAVVEGRLWDVDEQNRFGDARVRDLLKDATRGLANADAVVHAIDVTGMGSDRSLTLTRSPEDSQRAVPGRESLNLISAETGGRFFKDTNNLDAVLNEMADMTSRYYVLGFQPGAEKGPGSYHKIKVKVARKSARLSHRAGYYERVPVASQTPLQRQFESAQLVMTGVGPSELSFSILCLPFPEKGDRQTLGLVVQVPKSELRWIAGQDTALEVYAYAVAEDGTVMDHLAQLARVDPGIADADGTRSGLSFYGGLRVPAGKYTVRLLVQERDSGDAGVQVMEVTVPPYNPRAGFLLPPVVLEDGERWLNVEMGRARDAGRPSPFTVNGQPFLPRASFRVQPGTAEKLMLISYEPDAPADPAAGVSLRSSMTDRQGNAVAPGALRIQKVHREESGRRAYLLGYTPEAAPGDYTLRIAVGEAGARLESYSLLKLIAGGS